VKRVAVFSVAALLVAIGLVATPTSSAASPTGEATAAPAPRGDFPCGTHTAGGARITACEDSTGVQGMTPMIQTNSRGTLFMTVATENEVVKFPDVLVGGAPTSMLRSRDDGRSWTEIPLPAGIIASEAIIHLDKATDRLFALSMSYDLTNCGYPVGWTDDEGETWQTARTRPGCVPITVGDWPKLFTGPFPAGIEPTGDYPRAIYTCNFVPNILVAASLWCWSSRDGGQTFGNPTMLPVLNGVCLATDGTGTIHGNGPETIVHGTGQVLPDGTVVVPVSLCGRAIVVRSTDGAPTWTVHDTGSDGVGWFNWLQNLDTQTGADNVYNMMLQQGLAQDDRGNLFLPYPATGGLKLAYSTDGGVTWKQRGVISTPEVAMPWVVSAEARGNGELALSYMATPDKGELVLGGGERFRNWIGYSRNAMTEPFTMAATSPIEQPAVVAGGIAGQSVSCCATLQYFIEYTGVSFTGRDQVRAAFVRKGEEKNPILTLGRATIGFPSYAVKARADKRRVRSGTTVRIRGTVSPVPEGGVVQLQVRRDGRWVPAGKARVTAAGSYRFRERLRGTGTRTFRVAVPASPTVDGATSRKVSVKVRRR
jgi:hypothetical protein